MLVVPLRGRNLEETTHMSVPKSTVSNNSVLSSKASTTIAFFSSLTQCPEETIVENLYSYVYVYVRVCTHIHTIYMYV